MMCDAPINKSIAIDDMNIPLSSHEVSAKMDSPNVTMAKDDAMVNTNQIVPTDERTKKKYVHNDDDDDSSSGDEYDDDDDEGNSYDGKGAEGTRTKTLSTVLNAPLRYTKSGRKRSIPFPVRVSTAC